MSKTVSRLLLVSLIVAFAGSSQCQQLLLIRKGSVATRYNESDEIYFQLKDQRQIHHTTIQTIREFYFLTASRDTIPYSRVESVHFRNYERKKFGAVTTLTGFGLLGVYGLNTLAFDEDTPAMRGLRIVAFMGIVVGTVIYFRAERKIKLGGRTRLKFVSYDSPLYR